MNFEKAEKVWDWIARQGVGFSKGKQQRGTGLSNRSVATYRTEFRSIMKGIEQITGKNDPMKIKPNDVYAYVQSKIGEYEAGNKSVANHLRRVDDVLHAFQTASKVSGVYHRELRMGDKRKISAMLNEHKVYRKAEHSKVAMASRSDMEKVVRELEKSKSPAKHVAIAAVKLEFFTGRRISAILRSKVENYDPVKGTYETLGDKGGKDNVNVGFLPKEGRELLDELTKGKKTGRQLLSIQYTQDKARKGQDKTVENMRKQVSGLIKEAAKRAGVNHDGKSVSSHSMRKGFAVERAIDYITNMTDMERRAELERRKSMDPRLAERIDNVLENIRKKFKNKANAAMRQFTSREVIQLLVSTDISHQRLDVLRYYLRKTFWEKNDFDFKKHGL